MISGIRLRFNYGFGYSLSSSVPRLNVLGYILFKIKFLNTIIYHNIIIMEDRDTTRPKENNQFSEEDSQIS
jgi:hypothetical protein